MTTITNPEAARWFTPPTHEYSRHDNGDTFAFDAATGRTWQIAGATLDLLQALRDGWQPGQEPPAALARHIPPGPPAAELHEALEELATEGLAVRAGEAPTIPLAVLAPVRADGWRDIRLHLLTVPALGPRLRAVLLGLARIAPALVAASLALSVWILLSDVQKVGISRWAVFVQDSSLLERAATIGGAMLFLTLVHELGHALLGAAATGRPMPLGIRLNHGIPQGFADVSAAIGAPGRRERVATILGGVAVESLAWLPFLPWVHTGRAPAFACTVMLMGGGLSLLTNLLPFWKNDGYLLLCELTRTRDLMDRAVAAAARQFLGSAAPGDRAWLGWYGLFHVHAIAVMALLGGVFFGRLMELELPLSLLGVGAAGVLLFRSYREMLAATRRPAAA